MSRVKPAGKILCFDLETSNLEANRGHIICAAAKWVGESRIFKWRIDDTKGFGKTPASFTDDRGILGGLIPLLEEADAVLAYYGSGFDVPYVNTRALIGRLKPPVPFTVIDPWKTASSKLRLARNSMEAVAAAVGAEHKKQHLPWEDWDVARYGDKKAIDKLIKYNVNDVLVLEDVYYKLRPLMSNHPYLGAASGQSAALRCPSCGSGNTHARGSRRTRVFEVYRRRCGECDTSFEAGRKK